MKLIPVIIASVIMARAASAWAEDCPQAKVEENGGKHWCFSTGKPGHVHLWTPDGYDPKTAVTVVYVHGHDIGADDCVEERYVDCVWRAHGLAERFSKSGLNALFVAVEGPTRPYGKPKWTSLDVLLKAMKKRGGILPPKRVIAVGHSAGIHTVKKFLGDARVVHVIALDALYSDAPKRLRAWYRGAKGRRLTLVGAESRHAQVRELGAKLGCAHVAAISVPYPRDARCVAAEDEDVGHMDVVKDGFILPTALARAAPAEPPRKAKPKVAKKRRRGTRR